MFTSTGNHRARDTIHVGGGRASSRLGGQRPRQSSAHIYNFSSSLLGSNNCLVPGRFEHYISGSVLDNFARQPRDKLRTG
ncbi:hypothetical protein PUN28_004148 [Cardiocondyla obscurior]|uniref:Uncharacterized protein n=1 Tax=Cardiocondyla obscurior TaxID=286306 RepID=A0AAW2GPQ9_9HYME